MARAVSLTMVVTVTYVVSIREHVISSIRARRWLQLFTGLA